MCYTIKKSESSFLNILAQRASALSIIRWVGINQGYTRARNKPSGHKKGADAVAPLSILEASNTLVPDNDNNRHPRQSFIYNTSFTDMLIYGNSRGVSVVSSLDT